MTSTKYNKRKRVGTFVSPFDTHKGKWHTAGAERTRHFNYDIEFYFQLIYNLVSIKSTSHLLIKPNLFFVSKFHTSYTQITIGAKNTHRLNDFFCSMVKQYGTKTARKKYPLQKVWTIMNWFAVACMQVETFSKWMKSNGKCGFKCF